MKKIITFGELMLRLEPEWYLRFVQADRYQATFGGGEANVAVSLANFGLDAAFVTKLPQHEQMCIRDSCKASMQYCLATICLAGGFS